jgi:hypothetical protein
MLYFSKNQTHEQHFLRPTAMAPANYNNLNLNHQFLIFKMMSTVGNINIFLVKYK